MVSSSCGDMTTLNGAFVIVGGEYLSTALPPLVLT
jgi:hypothetical protein